jgi:hypothetical protein
MPTPSHLADDTAAEAKRILHEDRVSANVARINEQLSSKLWVLHHAKSYLLGVLQLLEARNLLRDHEQEKQDAENHKSMLRAFGPARTPREKGYAKLCHLAADALPPSFAEALKALRDVRTDEELAATQGPTVLDVHAWRHAGSSEDALALARVRKLASDTWRRKTISRQDLLDALNPLAESEGER